MTDQQRGDALGCMGNPYINTPHLDQLAAEGTLFVCGYTSTPSSTPARSGLLTGLSPWHHGMLGYGAVAPQYKYEMPQMLRDLGYYTFGIGKCTGIRRTHCMASTRHSSTKADVSNQKTLSVITGNGSNCKLREKIRTKRALAGMITEPEFISWMKDFIRQPGPDKPPVN